MDMRHTLWLLLSQSNRNRIVCGITVGISDRIILHLQQGLLYKPLQSSIHCHLHWLEKRNCRVRMNKFNRWIKHNHLEFSYLMLFVFDVIPNFLNSSQSWPSNFCVGIVAECVSSKSFLCNEDKQMTITKENCDDYASTWQNDTIPSPSGLLRCEKIRPNREIQMISYDSLKQERWMAIAKAVDEAVSNAETHVNYLSVRFSNSHFWIRVFCNHMWPENLQHTSNITLLKI